MTPRRRPSALPRRSILPSVLTASLVLASGLGLATASAATAAPLQEGGCTPSATTLCLDSGRFQVEVDWTEGANSGEGEVVSQFSDTSGFFSLRDPDVADILLRVIDGCGTNGNYWVFLADTSNLGQTITVTDLDLANQVQYQVSEGVYAQPVTDLSAFPCTVEFPIAQVSPEESEEAFVLGGGGLFLDQRFVVEVEYEDFGGATGVGLPIPVTERSGAFLLFSPDNLEILVKIEPNTTSGFYELVYSALTTVELDFTVTDTCSGAVQMYNQPLGSTSTVADLTAFSVACTASIFGDGFESGDLTGWSSSQP